MDRTIILFLLALMIPYCLVTTFVGSDRAQVIAQEQKIQQWDYKVVLVPQSDEIEARDFCKAMVPLMQKVLDENSGWEFVSNDRTGRILILKRMR